VKVVYVHNAVKVEQALTHQVEIDVIGHAIEQQVQRAMEQRPRSGPRRRRPAPSLAPVRRARSAARARCRAYRAPAASGRGRAVSRPWAVPCCRCR
jgi:hypothetical protein